jgi:hypothetical protein
MGVILGGSPNVTVNGMPVAREGDEVTGSGSAGPPGPPGPPGADGSDGAPGANGVSPTITVGNTITLTPGSTATVNSTGNSTSLVLNFGIPKGDEGITRFKNILHNGNFNFWQRGTTGNTAPGGLFLADRWSNLTAGGTTISVSRQPFTAGQTDVPNEPVYYWQCVVTSNNGASDSTLLRQWIEDVRTTTGRTMTLSFYAKADTAGKKLAFEMAQVYLGSAPDLAIGVTQFTLSTSWQKFNYTFTSIPATGKTINSSNATFTQIGFWMDAGSSNNSRTGSLGNQSGTFSIAQVQLEYGNVATDFEVMPLAVELPILQRYYEHNFAGVNVFSPDGTPMPGNTSHYYVITTKIGPGGVAGSQYIPFKVQKKSNPTITFYSSDSASSPNNQWQGLLASSWITAGATAVARVSQAGFSADITFGTTLANGAGYTAQGNWTADTGY